MKKTNLLLAAVLALGMAGCVEVPENVKTPNTSPDSIVEINRSDLSSMNKTISEVKEHLKDRGYLNKFILSDKIELYKADRLYELELESVSEVSEKFPEIYNAVFDRDFKSDAKTDTVAGLPKVSEVGADAVGFINFDTNADGLVAYYRSRNSRASTNLEVTDIGFVGWCDDSLSFGGRSMAESICPYRSDFTDTEYKMPNGSKLSVSSASKTAEEKANKVFGIINSDFEYRTRSVTPIPDENSGRFMYRIQLEKTFEGVPFNDLDFGGYEKGETRIKQMYISSEMQSVEKPSYMASQWGFERVISKKELSSELISLPASFDILNNLLAPEIKLNITDIRLVYTAQYTAPDADELKQIVDENGGDYSVLTQEQRLVLGQPEMTPGRRFICHPTWVFIMGYPRKKDADGYYSKQPNCDCIMVDAVTGEVFDFIKRVYSMN